MSGNTTAIERLLEVSNKLWDAMYESGEVPTYAERAHYYLALKDAMDESAKLREQVDAAHMSRLLTENENESLRELVRDMWFWGYEGHMDSESQEWQMKHIGGVLDRMRELGIEVD